ncbi:MAG: hypothetical protein HYZ34_00170 [Ignavibacteriae bacterium]|nr:hypothetical protein [Ignavibacteriota bacterium]
MLQKIFGEIQFKYKANGISTRIEDYYNLEIFDSLSKIHTCLVRFRNYNDFAKSKSLQRCDLYIPQKKYIVETDETQHFTYPRYLSIKNYPPSLSVGYDLDWYSRTCQNIKSVDNDPKYRDEQRAWYDTLRDFLPKLYNDVNLTIRIPLGFQVWCSLDPTNKKDVDVFHELALGFAK